MYLDSVISFFCLDKSKTNSQLDKEGERLTILLELVDYSNGIRALSIRLACYSILLDLLEIKNIQIELDIQHFLFYLPLEQAAKLTIE